MRIFIIDRDLEEIRGIEWFLKNYLSSKVEISYATSCEQLLQYVTAVNPHALLIEMELITPTVQQILHALSIPIIAITAEPTFQQAMMAIKIRAIQLFVKPIPLEQLKSALITLPIKKERVQPKNQIAPELPDLYLQLFINDPQCIAQQNFVLIEPANFKHNLALYQWLVDSPFFDSFKALPLQNRIFALMPANAANQKLLRLLMQEWQKFYGEQLNIAIYDGENATLQTMYTACKQTLAQRFYKGYGHIFSSSDSLTITRFDPLLTPEQQQLWINSLENGDMKTIKAFLYHLTNVPPFYHYDEVRIHLTSILAQIRRFMLKYHLHHQAKMETQYRALFHLLLEHPILYAIVQEFILFTQQLIQIKLDAQQTLSANYAELAVEYIESCYENNELSLTMIAQHLNINANYLSTLFSKKRGVPLKKFLQQFRVQQAAKLLLETTIPIGTIAESVGFSDSNYFIKVFRDYYHVTPYRYRMEKERQQ